MLTGALGDLGDERSGIEGSGGGYSLLNLLPDTDFSGFGTISFQCVVFPVIGLGRESLRCGFSPFIGLGRGGEKVSVALSRGTRV